MRSHRLDLSRGLGAEPGGELLHRLDVPVAAEGHLGAVEADHVHADRQLVRTGLVELHLLQPQHVRSLTIAQDAPPRFTQAEMMRVEL
nr:hypothetical protein [Streptomyces vilmorinianum]